MRCLSSFDISNIAMTTEQEYYQELARSRSRIIAREKNIEIRNDSERSRLSKKQSRVAQSRNPGVRRRDVAQTVYKVAHGPKAKAPFAAISLGSKLRKQMKEGEGAAFEAAYVFAAVIDFIDYIPVAGWIVTLFFKPALFIMLWGYGTWKLKLARFILISLDLIPGINLLPMSIISVAYTHHAIKIKKVEAEQKLEDLQKIYGNV